MTLTTKNSWNFEAEFQTDLRDPATQEEHQQQKPPPQVKQPYKASSSNILFS